MRAVLFLVVAFASLCLVVGAKDKYDGWMVVRALINTQDQFTTVSSWDLDVWSWDSNLIFGYNDILVNDLHIINMYQYNITVEILIPNIQNAIDREEQEMRVDGLTENWFNAYHTYDDIVTYLANTSAYYPTLVKYIPKIGASIEGRAIPAVIVTGTSTTPKKKVMVIGGQHAREWIAPATVLYILQQFVTLYGTDSGVTSLLDAIEIHIVPLANPDGYVFTWTQTRLWRKNRRANVGGSYGVDLNRNWNDHWSEEGASTNPTSDTYCGTAPFSEPESTAISGYISTNGPFSGFVDYHSYSQLIMWPYGWTTAPPQTNPLLKSIGETWKSTIYAVNRVNYTPQPANQLYFTSGGSRDWCFTEAKVPLSYTLELRDTGTYGFVLPPAQIVPTGQENWAGFIYFLQAVIANT